MLDFISFCSIMYITNERIMENKVKGVCYVCGEPLIWDENSENCYLNDYLDEDEGMVVKEIRCEHCGTLYQHYITNENKADSEEDYISCGDQGFGNCAHCGGTIVWSGDFMRSDFFDDPSDEDGRVQEDDDAIVRSLTCGHCGCALEVYEPSLNEMKSGKFPYWEEYFKEKEKNGTE